MKEKQVRYKEYRGALTPKQAAEGINAATRNAAHLLADAEILYNAGSYYAESKVYPFWHNLMSVVTELL